MPQSSNPRSLVGRGARALVEAVKGLTDRATRLVQAPEYFRAEARQRTADIASQQVEAVLRDRPITDLRDFVGKGTRLNRLQDAGFRTIADVLHARMPLTSVQGVGPQTAAAVDQAARFTAAQVQREVRVRLDPDTRLPSHTALLASLSGLRRADEAAALISGPLSRFAADTESVVQDARPATSRARWLITRGSKKSVALQAVARLEQIATSPWFAEFGNAVGQHESNVARPDDVESLWHDFEVNAAAYNTLLSTVGVAAPDDAEAFAGFIPDELRQQITATPLDTSLMKATLREYQVFGTQYALHQGHSIIGDEMGLGKTLQALAAMAHLAANNQRRFLVVCPASVHLNWLNEIERHTRLAGVSLHGASRNVAVQQWLRTGGIAVTTFNTLSNLEIEDVEVALLVVDEAHYVKNPNANRSRAVVEAVGRSQRTLFLTGTPMENRVEEFRNLVSYLQPDVARRLNAADAIAGARTFRRSVADVYLRRNQEDVLAELPDKIEVEDWVQLTRADELAYREAAGRGHLMHMRQAAYLSDDSAKLERIAELVGEAADDGYKVIVFSYFLEVLARIGGRVGDSFGPITGAVSSAGRQEIIDRFTHHRGHGVLLAQIEAGGVGLNIQAASVVVIAEPQWKPSIEEQAIARAHRMGQTRKVQVHRILAKDSVDERIREVQERKSALFAEFARKSDAKLADPRAVDGGLVEQVVQTEQRRLGLIP